MGQEPLEGEYVLCPACGWSGPSDDLVGDPSTDCPVCGERLGG